MRRESGHAQGSLPESVVARASVAISTVLTVALGAAYFFFRSQLALAQAADSLLDVATAVALGYAVVVASHPPDENHPFGHHSAQPIAALFTAVLAGGLGVSVFREALDALVSTAEPALDWPLAVAFALKVVAKSLLSGWASRVERRARSPAMQAIAVDARNDVLVGIVGLVGFFSARQGLPALDAWLALPVALWIFYAGLELGRDNVRLLMGEAPDQARQEALLAIAKQVPGALDAHSLKARWQGAMLALWVQIRVDPELTVQAAHDIGEAVERRLLEEHDVVEAVAHIDVV